jgi:hypothetical protein
MFARFVPLLQQAGCDITLLCHPALNRLFRESFSVRVIAAVGTVDFPDPDLWLFSNSLLSAMVSDRQDIPQRPYLCSPPAIATSARVGIGVRGNPTQANDAQRSLPAELAEDLLSLPGAMSLHPEDTGAKDFWDTAAIVAGLDLVITVDTSIAHLAGAMGKPVWVLVTEAGTCWRWMRRRTDNDWYPSARLFRQHRPGDWRGVLDDVKKAYASHTATPAGQVTP